jgi:hypothetical protein
MREDDVRHVLGLHLVLDPRRLVPEAHTRPLLSSM